MFTITVCLLLTLLGEIMCQNLPSTSMQTTPIVTERTTSENLTSHEDDNDVATGFHGTEEDFEERLERSRNARMFFLRQHVLASLGWNTVPDIDQETKRRLLNEMRSTPVYVTRQKSCYFPMCDLPMMDLPDYMNRSLWFDTSSRNIRYFFAIPTEQDPNLEVTSAIIKLHLKRRDDCPCAYDDAENSSSRLHIKVYQYKKPIRSHSRLRHSNMRLIDARMVTWDSERWVSLQVTEAVKRIMLRGKRNGGFEVHVRDMEENILDAKTIIDPTVCTTTQEYDCTHRNDDVTTDEEPDDPNYSPVLEISSTLTTRLEIS